MGKKDRCAFLDVIVIAISHEIYIEILFLAEKRA